MLRPSSLRLLQRSAHRLATGIAAAVLLFAATDQASADREWARNAFAATSGASSGQSGGTWSGFSWGQGFDYGGTTTRRAAGGRPTMSKRGIEPLKKAIAYYRSISKAGGWKKIPKSAVGLESGSRGAAVQLLRARLRATGDLRTTGGFATTFDYYVARALQRFQERHGLKPTGNLVDKSRRYRNGSRTLAALNVPASSRVKQLRANLNRMRRKLGSLGKRYILVNIPAQELEAVEGDQVASRHVAVVGKKARATPILSSKVFRVKFNPDWTLPPTVIRKDLIPKGRRMARAKQSVLTRYGIDAYTSHGGRKLDPKRVNWSSSSVYNYVYKQEPGPENPLGFVKIDFHNAHAVYIHDTPSKRVFGRADRAASSGCVRVQDISRLVTWMLRGNGNWSAGRVAQMKKSGESLNVSLKRQVPVHFVYMTSWVAPDGSVQFRRDLYGKDRRYGVSRLASQ